MFANDVTAEIFICSTKQLLVLRWMDDYYLFVFFFIILLN